MTWAPAEIQDSMSMFTQAKQSECLLIENTQRPHICLLLLKCWSSKRLRKEVVNVALKVASMWRWDLCVCAHTHRTCCSKNLSIQNPCGTFSIPKVLHWSCKIHFPFKEEREPYGPCTSIRQCVHG